MNRNYTNINQVAVEDLDTVFPFCFTYTIPSKCSVRHFNKNGHTVKRLFGTLTFSYQKDILKNGIDQLNGSAYYFEQHIDGRHHLHGFCTDTARNVLLYMKARFEEIRCAKVDIQEKLLMCEVVSYPPLWVEYCLKENSTQRDIYSAEIEKFTNGHLGVDAKPSPRECRSIFR